MGGIQHQTIVMFRFHSVQFSSSVMSDSLRPHELQHARPPCPSPTPSQALIQGWSSEGKAQDFYLIVVKKPSLFLSLNLNT